MSPAPIKPQIDMTLLEQVDHRALRRCRVRVRRSFRQRRSQYCERSCVQHIGLSVASTPADCTCNFLQGGWLPATPTASAQRAPSTPSSVARTTAAISRAAGDDLSEVVISSWTPWPVSPRLQIFRGSAPGNRWPPVLFAMCAAHSAAPSRSERCLWRPPRSTSCSAPLQPWMATTIGQLAIRPRHSGSSKRWLVR